MLDRRLSGAYADTRCEAPNLSRKVQQRKHRSRLLSAVAYSLLMFTGVCASGQTNASPTPREILGRYGDTLLPPRIISAKISTQCWAHQDASPERLYPEKVEITYRRDRNRTEWIGHSTRRIEDGTDHRFPIKETMGEKGYIWAYDFGEIYGVVIRGDFKDRQAELLEEPTYGGFLDGLVFGNKHQNVANLLSGASDLRLRPIQEKVRGESCYVLEAVTDYGTVTAWIDPNVGFTCPKWSIRKDSASLFDDKPMAGKSWVASFDAARTEQISKKFLVTAGHLTIGDIDKDGKKYEIHYECARTAIDLDPDFEALGAFEIGALNLPDGSIVTNHDIPGIRFRLEGGKLVPIIDKLVVEELDKVTAQILRERGMPPGPADNSQPTSLDETPDRPEKGSGTFVTPVSPEPADTGSPVSTVECRRIGSTEVVLVLMCVLLSAATGAVVIRRRKQNTGGKEE
jgi:hypothetical protein